MTTARVRRVPEQMSRPTAIDLFSGCGGLSLGLIRAGFRVVAGIEMERKTAHTFRLNHTTVKLYEQDIRTLSPYQILRQTGLKSGQLDLLAGCPPCQGFSRLRTRNSKGAARDERNELITEFMRFIKVMKPKTIMLENVPALARDVRLARFRRQLDDLNYKHVVQVLDVADYHVPQRRKRMILLASRIHVPTIARAARSRVSVRTALSRLNSPATSVDELHRLPENRSRAVVELISQIPKNGGSRSDLGRKHQLPCHLRSDGFHDVYGRMSWDDVAPTITSGCNNPSKGRFLHPRSNRAITLREAALLQGFPIRYKFDVSHGKEAIALMIGNALPPPFVAAHARVLRKGIAAAHRTEG